MFSRRSLSLAPMVMFLGVLLAGTALFPSPARAEGSRAVSQDANIFTFADLLVFPNGTPVGSATLFRNNKGIAVSLSTSGLEVGTPVTIWFVVWNNPDGCARTVTPFCNDTEFGPGQVDFVGAAGNVVVNPDGTFSIGGGLKEGDISESLLGRGLDDAKKAEIHIIVRTHPNTALLTKDEVVAAINSVAGACGVAPGCEDIQAAVFFPPTLKKRKLRR